MGCVVQVPRLLHRMQEQIDGMGEKDYDILGPECLCFQCTPMNPCWIIISWASPFHHSLVSQLFQMPCLYFSHSFGIMCRYFVQAQLSQLRDRAELSGMEQPMKATSQNWKSPASNHWLWCDTSESNAKEVPTPPLPLRPWKGAELRVREAAQTWRSPHVRKQRDGSEVGRRCARRVGWEWTASWRGKCL